MNGILFGCFDVLHHGHVRAINYCLRRCDHLTIGLFTDDAIIDYKRKTPMIKYRYRKQLIEEIFPLVTVVPVYKRHWLFFPMGLSIDTMFVSESYKSKLAMEIPFVKVQFIPHTKGVSSTLLKGERNGN
jgi:cytidyltransferase-like protein